MSKAYDKIIALLGMLTASEKAKLYKRLQIFIKLGPQETDTPIVQDYLFEGIHFELRRRGLLGLEARITNSRFLTFYKITAIEVRALLESKLPRLDSASKNALGVVAIRALADYLAARNIAIEESTLLQHSPKIPTALDESFPGYLNGGHIPFIWKKECRTKPPPT